MHSSLIVASMTPLLLLQQSTKESSAWPFQSSKAPLRGLRLVDQRRELRAAICWNVARFVSSVEASTRCGQSGSMLNYVSQAKVIDQSPSVTYSRVWNDGRLTLPICAGATTLFCSAGAVTESLVSGGLALVVRSSRPSDLIGSFFPKLSAWET